MILRAPLFSTVIALALAVPTVLSAPFAAAQSATGEEPAADRRMIGQSEFRELFMGKTVYFQLENGSPWGREYYEPNSQRSVFVFTDGACFEGRWEKVDDRYCFFYRDQPSCWLTFWEGDRITVVSREGMRQQVGRIAENEPLSCQPDVVSQGPMSRAAPRG